jgi:hypothetical protein
MLLVMLGRSGVFGGRDGGDGSCPVTVAIGGCEAVGPGEPGCACDLGEGTRRGRLAAEHLVGPVPAFATVLATVPQIIRAVQGRAR